MLNLTLQDAQKRATEQRPLKQRKKKKKRRKEETKIYTKITVESTDMMIAVYTRDDN